MEKNMKDLFDDDDQAWEVLKDNFNDDAGIIYPKVLGYKATEMENSAIDYLWEEWDYGYLPSKPEKKN